MSEIRVIHAEDREVAVADATSGMIREQAIADDGLWAGVVTAAPQRPSGWHHHGEHDTYFYVDAGEIRMEFGPDGNKTVEAGPGDFVHVPKNLVHREMNSSSEEARIVLVRVGHGPPVVNVEEPTD